MKAVWRLIHLFIDIALHRRTAADVPASQLLLGLVLLADLAIAVTALQLADLPRPLAQLAFDTLLYFGAIWLALSLFGRAPQFIQTATAFVGTDAFLNAITLPVLLWNQRLETPSDASMPQLLLLVLFLWYVDIGGWILSKALGRPYVVGVGIMLVYVLTSMALRDALFPVTT